MKTVISAIALLFCISAQAITIEDLAKNANKKSQKETERVIVYILGVIDSGEGYSHCLTKPNLEVAIEMKQAFVGHSGYGDENAAHFMLKALAQVFPCQSM